MMKSYAKKQITQYYKVEYPAKPHPSPLIFEGHAFRVSIFPCLLSKSSNAQRQPQPKGRAPPYHIRQLAILSQV
jgi:hypothetical protein